MLTDTLIRRAKPQDKRYRLTDAEGLYLEVMPTGAKFWRVKFRLNGRSMTTTIGSYPMVSLQEARVLRGDTRRKVFDGINPNTNQVSGLFRDEARWLLEKLKIDLSASHFERQTARLENYILPKLGNLTMAEITPTHVLDMANVAVRRQHIETAHRLVNLTGQVFDDYNIRTHGTHDPTLALTGALPSSGEKHYPAVTDEDDVGKLLRAIDSFVGMKSVESALRLHPYVFVRPSELRGMRVEELDLDRCLWIIPAERMKKDRDHVVPLSRQAVAIIREQLTYAKDGLMFPGAKKNRPISDATMNGALAALGYKDVHTPHGWRSTAMTNLEENLNFSADLVDMQLSHKRKDKTKAAYSRGKWIKQRTEMMQAWADWLDSLR